LFLLTGSTGSSGFFVALIAFLKKAMRNNLPPAEKVPLLTQETKTDQFAFGVNKLFHILSMNFPTKSD